MRHNIEQQLSDLYISNMDVICNGLPAAVNSARRNYMESFMLSGIPSSCYENYRHSDLRKLFSGKWEYFFCPDDDSNEFADCGIEGYNLELHNGFCRGGLTELDNGIMYGSLREALVHENGIALKYYNSATGDETAAVTALNSVFMQDGAFIYIPEGIDADMPFILTCNYSADTPRICFPRILIVVGEGSRASLFINHRQEGFGRILSDAVRETILGTSAHLDINEVTEMGDESSLVYGIYTKQSGLSRADMMNVWMNAGMTRVNAVTDLEGEDCDSTLKGLYFGTGDQRTDINITVNHLVPDCRSSELVKAIVSGNAVGAFTGRVYVAPGAQKTSAFQQSRNLQMSETARIYTEPQLEIYADDVKCSHGATIGQMDDEMILYMRQRGISEKDAKRLRLFGFVNDVISGCTVTAACESITERAEKRISEL